MNQRSSYGQSTIRAGCFWPSPVGYWTATACDHQAGRDGPIHGSVLDVGCGTGENLLYLAARGHDAWGLDFVPVAIERAKAKAAQRKIEAHFIIGDALKLEKLGRRFNTVIDCGLFHTFADEERPAFIKGLAEVLRPGGLLHILCFSTKNLEPRGRGESASRKSAIRSMMAGRFNGSTGRNSSRFHDLMGRSSALVVQRHGWRRLNGRETLAVGEK